MFVRWENQSVETALDPRLPGFSEDIVVRRFDAPEALDTRFHEVRTKSAINRVPTISRVPFEYDGQSVSRLLPCVLLLQLGHDAGAHGRRPDAQDRGSPGR